MKRNTGKKKEARKAVPMENIYFRLCHVCFHLNESQDPIEKCESCENDYANPFLKDYYTSSEDDEDSSEAENPVRKGNIMLLRKNLTGLSVVW